jgi:hypothetical protein
VTTPDLLYIKVAIHRYCATSPHRTSPSHDITSTPPSATGTAVTAGSELEKAIQKACGTLELNFGAEHDDDWIKKTLYLALPMVSRAISQAGDSNQKGRLKNQSEFEAYVKPGSDGERELIKFLRSMAKQEVPWRDLLDNGTLFSSL